MQDEQDDRGPGRVPEATQGSGFLERWSRLKVESRAEARAVETPPAQPASAGDSAAPAQSEPPGDDDTPPLDSLTEDSDYSVFLSPRVSPGLRRAALRKLFHSPKFNVCDGLSDYCQDYTRFEPLGDVLTADMRHQIERAAEAALAAESAGDGLEAHDQAPAAPSAQEPDDDRSEPA